MSRSTLAVAGLLAFAVPTFAQSALPSDLALVPGDAVGFLHVKVADVWKSEVMKDARLVFEKAGPDAIAAFDEQFHPAPSTIDRVTLVVLPGEKPDSPSIATVLAFNKPFDAAKVRTSYMPKGVEMKAGGKTYFADDQSGVAIQFVNDKTLVFSDGKMLPKFLEAGGKSDGVLKSAIEAAAKQQFTAAANVAKLPLPPDFADNVPLDVRPALKAERIVLNMTLASETSITVNFGYKNAADAAAGEKAIRKAAEMGRTALVQGRNEAEAMLLGKGKPRKAGVPRPLEELPEAVGGLAMLGGLNTLDEILAAPPLKLDGDTVAMKVTLPTWMSQHMGITMASAGLLLPAVQKTRNASARIQSSNNLKQIGLAMHDYHDTYRGFPAAAIVDKKRKKLLSWRVAILPFIEQDNLYKQFKLDEPWDSDHNKKLIPIMPKIYADPRQPSSDPTKGETYYKVFVGKNAGFDWVQGRVITRVIDGTSNTIMVAAGGDPVVWTKPDDFEFDPLDEKAKLPELVKPFDTLLTLFMDGSVRTINPEIKDFEKIMRLLICPNDGMVIPDFDR
jgi:hypothetical protein